MTFTVLGERGFRVIEELFRQTKGSLGFLNLCVLFTLVHDRDSLSLIP